jgi:serine/threonine-protein kinase
MPPASVAALLDTLQRGRLLEPAQVEALSAVKPPFPDAHALAKELVHRNWLTPYQVNKVFQGKTGDLVLGQYILLERLGEGGMGEVFKARHHLMNRIVALKLIKPELLALPQAQLRFRQEIEAAAQCVHPNIVIAHDADEVGGKHFLTMEFVAGTNLAIQVKNHGPLPIALACDYARQTALALQHAHEKNLVHRDVKPSNLLLVPAKNGQSGGTVKLLDLGLARLRGTNSRERRENELTDPGAVVGTADYMAPEQALDSRQADIRADIYSLGCTLYFLLSGHPPFPGGTSMEKLFLHHQMEPEPIELSRPDMPPGLAAGVRKLMAKKLEERYQTPTEVIQALEPFCRLANGPLLATDVMPATALDVAAPVVPAWSALTAPSSPTAVYELPPPDYVPMPNLQLPPPRRLAGKLLVGGAAVLVVGMLSLFLYLVPRPTTATTNATVVVATGGTAKEANIVFTNSIGMKLVRLPAGKFMMGSPDAEVDREEREGPVHEVTLTKPFSLGVHEVTVGQFRAFADATGYKTEAESTGEGAYRLVRGQGLVQDPDCTWRSPVWKQEDTYPVVCVSWNDAQVFCTWLSNKEKRTYRLPTEAEWEYACRAGSKQPFSHGPSINAHQANFQGDAPYGGALDGPTVGRPGPVGSYNANRFGLFDMHGNVEEWCADYYQLYSDRPQIDPVGPQRGAQRIVRGGSWANSGSRCRAAGRWVAEPSKRIDNRGFRVVCTVE